MFCSKCGTTNDDASKFCSSCGAPLASADQVETKATTDQEEFYKAVIGPKNQDYYLRRFQQFDQAGKSGVTWHWPAFFITFYWLLYRKMWLYALLIFLIPIVVGVFIGVLEAIYKDSGTLIIGLGYLAFWFAFVFLPPMYANALYYRQCKKKIAEVQASSSDVQRQLGELAGRGGTSNAALIVILILVFISVIGMLAAIAIPAYQDYTTRSHTSAARTVGNAAATAVTSYFMEHEDLPENLAASGFATPLPPSVQTLDFNNSNGIVTVTLATGRVAGKHLLLVPSLDENKQLSWTCLSQEIEDRYLPHECRQHQ